MGIYPHLGVKNKQDNCLHIEKEGCYLAVAASRTPDKVLQLIKLKPESERNRNRFRGIWRTKPVQNSQKPYDALSKAHRMVSESFEPVCTVYTPYIKETELERIGAKPVKSSI